MKQLLIPEYDCTVPGLGLYAEHRIENPLVGQPGSEHLIDEQVLFHLHTEPGGEEINLPKDDVLPIVFARTRKRMQLLFKRPRDFKGKLIAMQADCKVLFVGFSEVQHSGFYELHLSVVVHNPRLENPKTVLPSVVLHRYIRDDTLYAKERVH